MTTTASVGDVRAEVAALTGFDPEAMIGSGADVAVFGIGGTGVRSLVSACRRVDAGVAVDVGRSVDHPDDSAVGVALLVVDPTSSVGAEERALLDDLRVRFGVVALVCTKIDAFWEWPRILRAHRATLDPRAELPVFAVSSVIALDDATADSGIPGLLEWVADELHAPPAVRRERARLGAALAALGRAEDALIAAADDRGVDTDELARRRRALADTRDRGRVDRLAAARAGLARVRSESYADVAVGTRALAAEATTRSSQLTARTGGDFVRWLTDETVMLRDRVDAATDERLDEVRASALLGIDASPAEPGPARADDMTGPPFERPVPSRRRSGEDALLVLIGASTGLGIGRLIVAPMASVQTLQWVSMPLTLVLGVLVAALVIRVRRTATVRVDLRNWGSEVLNETRGRLEHRVGARVAAAEPALISQISRFHERRARQAAAEIAAIDEQLRAQRSGATAHADRERLARLRAARNELLRSDAATGSGRR
ncbi:hypothetical protein V1Y59_03895 [Gordonia sp. PKS22-38]|uniref:Uncharacterized protein n=1 Tax=Gordonia prachuapensis TaxID=3115651 RepID=A0ABU7MPF4_9ACTN|nr:hypothetical protein [Gordonia sp. PKS22-38]